LRRPLNVTHQLEIWRAAAELKSEAEDLLLQSLESVILDLLEKAGPTGIEYWELIETYPMKHYPDPVICGKGRHPESSGAFYLASKRLRDREDIVCIYKVFPLRELKWENCAEDRWYLPQYAPPPKKLKWWQRWLHLKEKY